MHLEVHILLLLCTCAASTSNLLAQEVHVDSDGTIHQSEKSGVQRRIKLVRSESVPMPKEAVEVDAAGKIIAEHLVPRISSLSEDDSLPLTQDAKNVEDVALGSRTLAGGVSASDTESAVQGEGVAAGAQNEQAGMEASQEESGADAQREAEDAESVGGEEEAADSDLDEEARQDAEAEDAESSEAEAEEAEAEEAESSDDQAYYPRGMSRYAARYGYGRSPYGHRRYGYGAYGSRYGRYGRYGGYGRSSRYGYGGYGRYSRYASRYGYGGYGRRIGYGGYSRYRPSWSWYRPSYAYYYGEHHSSNNATKENGMVMLLRERFGQQADQNASQNASEGQKIWPFSGSSSGGYGGSSYGGGYGGSSRYGGSSYGGYSGRSRRYGRSSSGGAYGGRYAYAASSYGGRSRSRRSYGGYGGHGGYSRSRRYGSSYGGRYGSSYGGYGSRYGNSYGTGTLPMAGGYEYGGRSQLPSRYRRGDPLYGRRPYGADSRYKAAGGWKWKQRRRRNSLLTWFRPADYGYNVNKILKSNPKGYLRRRGSRAFKWLAEVSQTSSQNASDVSVLENPEAAAAPEMEAPAVPDASTADSS